MSSIEIYNPEKTTGYVVDEYVNYDRSVYRCRLDTPKPAGPFDDTYWNLVGYILDGSGVINYSGETTEINFDDPEKFIYTEGNQTISGVKTFTDVIEMTKPEASSSKTSEKVVTVGWVNDPALSENVMHKDAQNIINRNDSIEFNNPGISTATNPTSNNYGSPIYFNDMYGNRTGYLRNGKLTDGNQFVGLQASRKIGTTDYYSSLDIGTTSDGTAFCNWQGSQLVTLGREQTFTAKQTFNNTVTVSKAFGASDFDIIKGSDTNGKGDSRFLGYYTGNQIYTRVSSYNKTSSKNMYLDVISKDDGNGVVTLGGGTTNLNMTTATAATNLAYVATMGWTNDPTKSTNVVHRTGDETISGNKTFSNEIKGRFRSASCHQGQDNTNSWFKLGTFNSPSPYNSHFVIFKMWCGSVNEKGSVNGRIVTRSGSNGTAGTVDEAGTRLEFDSCPSWLKLENFKLLYKANQGSEGSKYALFELWVKTHSGYTGFTFSIEDERAGGEAYNTSWTFYNKTAQTGESQASLPSGYTQLNSVLVNNQNTATTDGIYDWMGTLAQYNAQNIATTHPEWLCFITDDHTATAYSAYSKTESDNRYVKTADIDNKWKTLLSTLYPVGSLYIGTQTSCPLATLISGSTWVLVGQDRALWCGNGSNGNTTIEAGLPNITGTADDETSTGGNAAGGGYYMHKTGAFYNFEVTNKTARWASYNNSNTDPGFSLGFDASRSNSIYGKSTTVQPKAYRVNVWRRTA